MEKKIKESSQYPDASEEYWQGEQESLLESAVLLAVCIPATLMELLEKLKTLAQKKTKKETHV